MRSNLSYEAEKLTAQIGHFRADGSNQGVTAMRLARGRAG
tara:strand:+ start:1893 stop:2012 length:120 start_codon:yes stop_codon:yes gene_type:complete